MTLEQFRKLCSNEGIQEIDAVHVHGAKILLGERMKHYSTPGEPDPKPYYETFYSVETDGCNWAQCVNNDAYVTTNGIFRTSTREERIADAVKSAMPYIKGLLKARANG